MNRIDGPFVGDSLDLELLLTYPVDYEPGREYPLSLQIVSHADDTDGRLEIPRVPG